MTFTKEKFMRYYKPKGSQEQAFDNISYCLTEVGINTPNTLLGAMATVRVEADRPMIPILEYSSGKQYEGNIKLGNVMKGDGVKYKGRGLVQLTGRANYTKYGKLLGVDLVTNPDLALDLHNASRILAYFFKENGIDRYCNKENWVEVRRRVNGGTNGLDLFLKTIADYSK